MIVWINETPIDVNTSLAVIWIVGLVVIWALYFLSLRYGEGWEDSGEDKAKVIEVAIYSFAWPLVLVLAIVFVVADQVLKLSLDHIVAAVRRRRKM